MNTEVEIATNVDVEFDDSTVWVAVEDSVNEVAREAVDNYAWDAVSSDVESMIDDMHRHNDRTEGIDEHLDALLQQLKGRTERGDALCGLGTSARDAIIAVLRADNEERIPDSPPHTPDERQATEALEVQRRLADLERQMRTLLSAVTDLGERAASVTPNSVV